jgi:quinol monooxygenase YgiN
MNINLTVFIKSKAAYADDIRQMLQAMVVQSKQETACLQYDLHQGIDEPHIFIFHEVWQDEKGLALHNEQPYIKAFGEIIAEKLQEAPVIYKTIRL